LSVRSYPLIHRTPLRLGVFLCVAMIGAWAAVSQAGGMNAFHDAQFLSAYERHARLSVLQFGQLPLWDPYNCGGLYGLAAPQTRYASPFFLLSLLFGVDRGIALIAVLLPAIGMEGMYRYARRWGALALPSFLFAPLFPLSGWFGFSLHYGWVQFYSFCLVPWLLLGLRGTLRKERKSALLLAVVVAVTVGFGGTYTLPMAVVLCLAELLDAVFPSLRLAMRRGARSWLTHVRRRAARALVGLAWALPLVLSVSAYRLWPMLESVEATLRVMGGTPSLSVPALLQMLFTHVQTDLDGSGIFYVTPVIALALLAVPWRRTSALWLAAVLSFGLALGHASPYAPFVLLRKLPIYDTLRYPERYLLLFVLVLSLLTARGASTLLALARRQQRVQLRKLAVAGLIALAALAIGLEASNTRSLLARVKLVPSPVASDAPFRQSRGNRWLMSHFAAEGLGSIGCGEAYPLPMSKQLRGDLPHEEYLVPLSGPAQPRFAAKRISWSPNRVVVAVDSPEPVRLAINQNYHPGWRSTVGTVESWEGLLSVALPAGKHQVAVSFRPRSGIGGLLVTLVGLLGGLLFVAGPAASPRSLTRSPALQVLSLAMGPLLTAVLFVTWPEPPWQRPMPRTDQGEPVLLDQPPPHARKLDVRFRAPLSLEASIVPSEPLPARARAVTIELFFRRHGPLAASLGLFVHAFGPDGRDARADHPELSGQVYLARMPLGVVVRDAFVLPLPKAASGDWEVHVGVWHAYGSGARVGVRRARDDVRLQDGAIVIGRFKVSDP
jgi:hypothetical protein